jgi:acyl-CoA synthetase (NDP forming)
MQQASAAPHRLDKLFRPQSIAVVGASDRSAWSHQIMAAFKGYGYAGKVYLVNRRGADAFGQKTHVSCTAIGEPVDAALVAVPAESIMETLQDIVAAGIRHAVVLTSGFAEIGETGAHMQRAMQEYAREHGLVLLGPNSLGLYNAAEHAAMTTMMPLAQPVVTGAISLVSQSGSIASVMTYFAHQQNIGLRHVVAMGNEAVVELAEVIEYLVDDPGTRAIVLFAETVRNAASLAAAARRALQAKKPIVVLKVGRSELTTAVAQAHTGAMVGDDRVFDAFCRQYGVVRVDSLEDALVTADLIAAVGTLKKTGVGVVSISGGSCEILADFGEEHGVSYPQFSDATKAKLRELISEYGSTHNPFDITGAAVTDPSLFEKILPVIADDPAIGLTLCVMELVAPPGQAKSPLLEPIGNGLRKAATPGMLVTQHLKAIGQREREIADANGLPYVTSGLEYTSRAVGKLVQWSQRVMMTGSVAGLPALKRPEEMPRLDTERAVLDYLAGQGVPVIPAVVAKSAAEAVAAAEKIGASAYVLKIASPDIAHKTEAGGVRLHVGGAAAIEEAFEDIMRSVRAAKPDARIDGVIVSPMRDKGVELFVGTAYDPVWGPVIAVGLGGIWVEVLQDTALRLLPVTKTEVVGMLKGLRATKLLNGYRGAPAVNLEAAAEVIAKIGDAALALGPDLASLEINPLLASGSQVEALDGLVIWNDSKTA